MTQPRSVRHREPEASRFTGRTADDFSKRVMDSIADEPGPSASRGLLSALRVLSLPDAASALYTAWHLATVPGKAIRPGVRARSLALVLSAAALLGVGGSFAAASAVHIAQRAITQEQGETRAHQSRTDEQGYTTQTAVPHASGVAHAGTANPNIPQAETNRPHMGEGEIGQDGATGTGTREAGAGGTTNQEPGTGATASQQPGETGQDGATGTGTREAGAGGTTNQEPGTGATAGQQPGAAGDRGLVSSHGADSQESPPAE